MFARDNNDVALYAYRFYAVDIKKIRELHAFSSRKT